MDHYHVQVEKFSIRQLSFENFVSIRFWFLHKILHTSRYFAVCFFVIQGYLFLMHTYFKGTHLSGGSFWWHLKLNFQLGKWKIFLKVEAPVTGFLFFSFASLERKTRQRRKIEMHCNEIRKDKRKSFVGHVADAIHCYSRISWRLVGGSCQVNFYFSIKKQYYSPFDQKKKHFTLSKNFLHYIFEAKRWRGEGGENIMHIQYNTVILCT